MPIMMSCFQYDELLELNTFKDQVARSDLLGCAYGLFMKVICTGLIVEH